MLRRRERRLLGLVLAGSWVLGPSSAFLHAEDLVDALDVVRRPIRDFYTFVEIDRATSPGTVGAPSLGNRGTVAYFKREQPLSSGPCVDDPLCRAGIAAGDESFVEFVAELADGFRSFTVPPSIGTLPAPPAVSGGHHVAFKANLGDSLGTGGIFLADGSEVVTVALESGIDPQSPFAVLGPPSTNGHGLIAFTAVTIDGSDGIFFADGATIGVLVDSESPEVGLCCSQSIALNDQGVVAFLAEDPDGFLTIFVTNGTVTKPLVDTRGVFDAFPGFVVSLNDRGEVSFHARLDAGGHGLFVTDGNHLRTVALQTDADETSPYESISRGGHSINNEGVVAFAATVGGADGLFVGPDPEHDRIIGADDVLFDAPVVALQLFWTQGLNDRRQVAFTATLETGTVLYRGDIERQAIAIDVRPRNPHGLAPSANGNGLVPVTILGSASFDVHDVDLSTLAFGPAGARISSPRRHHSRDVNRDGHLDLVVGFVARDTGIGGEDDQACLTGDLLDGTPFEGCDGIDPLASHASGDGAACSASPSLCSRAWPSPQVRPLRQPRTRIRDGSLGAALRDGRAPASPASASMVAVIAPSSF